MSKHDPGLSQGPDSETPPPPLGLDAFDPVEEDDELVEDLRTVRMRAPHRRAVPSDIPSAPPVYRDEPEADAATGAEAGLDTEPMARPRPPVHEVAPPAPRVPSLAERAVRPKSALDAARDAANREAAAPAVVPPAVPVPGGDVVRAAIAKDLGGAGQIFVLETHEVSAGPLGQPRPGVLDREILRALWRGHRAKFLADGNLERAAVAAVVVEALERRGPLAVARVVAKGRDHVAFVDVEARKVIACLADAYSLVAAARPSTG